MVRHIWALGLSSKEQQALQAVLDRASVDREFRQRLLLDPQPAILEAFGVSIPQSFNVKFLEREPGVDALIVLPDLQAPHGELSDGDLDAVAGGVGGGDHNWFG